LVGVIFLFLIRRKKREEIIALFQGYFAKNIKRVGDAKKIQGPATSGENVQTFFFFLEKQNKQTVS
jgi:hypothetical protein